MKLIFRIVNHVTTTWKIAELLKISLGLPQMCNLAEIQDYGSDPRPVAQLILVRRIEAPSVLTNLFTYLLPGDTYLTAPADRTQKRKIIWM